MIQLNSLSLEKLDFNKHFGLIQGMSLDNKIKSYIAKDFIKWLEDYQTNNSDNIEVGKIYVIMDGNREVGIVGSTSFEDGILNVVYAVKRNLRDRGYGYRILKEITNYYLSNIEGIKGIKLEIDKGNKASIGVAKKSEYIKSNDINDKGLEEWYYLDEVSTKKRG